MTALHDRLIRQFARNSDAIAVPGGRQDDIRYGDLAAMTARLQQELDRRGVTALGVLSTRRVEAYVAVLSAFFSGIPFVPLNPDLPPERLAAIVQAAGVSLIVCDPSTAALAGGLGAPHLDIAPCLPGPAGAAPRQAPVADGATAYHMFTSGSTGTPKGVPVRHDSLSHYVTEIIAALEIPQGARFSQLFDLSFDLSLHDIFVGFASGGTLCPAGRMDLLMPHAYLAKKRIDIWFSVPMLAAQAVRGLVGKPPAHRLRMALFCGEALPGRYAADFGVFLQKDAPLYNLYGPTEATIALTARRFGPEQGRFSSVPLGTPFGRNRIAIEAGEGRITGPDDGAVGELLLGGPQVFDGYRPETGAACFVQDPDTGTRYYRSGDLVRVEAGEIVHMGRTDSQIKLRGYRIELGDIEAAVRRVFGCDVVAAVVLGAAEQREIGLAYEAGSAITDTAPLQDHLPAYMQPARWLRLDRMPVNINGKIDRKALRDMSWPA